MKGVLDECHNFAHINFSVDKIKVEMVIVIYVVLL